MALFSFDELINPVTRQEVQTSFYNVYATLGLKTSTWKSGAVVRAWTVASSIVVSAFSELQASIARSGFLELAEGPWLDLVGHYVYGLDRIAATFATGVITLVNGGGGIYEVDVDDLIFTNTATNKQYRNAAPFTLNPGQTLSVAIRAVEAGTGSNAGAVTIDEITTTLLQVTCSNPLALTALDEETDPAYRTRCSESLGSLSPFGPWDAYASAVRNATRPDGTNIGITRIRPVKDGFGNLVTYVAGPGGAINPDDLEIADEAIQRAAAPLAVNATVVSAIATAIPVTYEVWMYNTSGRTELQITTLIATRLAAFVAGQPVGGNRITGGAGKVYADAVRTVVAASWPQIFHVVVTLPAADVDIDADHVPVLGTVTSTAIHQIAPPDGVSP